jgi:acetyl esterase/lipase
MEGGINMPNILPAHKIMKRLVPVLLLIFSGFFSGNCTNKNQNTADLAQSDPMNQVLRNGPERTDSIVYKHTAQGDLKLYFNYPEEWTAHDSRAVIVFFFGGGWRSGSIEQFRFQAEYFAGRGMVTALADYRVFNRHGTSPDMCVEDGKSAVRWLREHAAALGVDPDRIIAAGGSAGGHVALCTHVVDGLEAHGEDLDISSKPDLLVLYNPVLKTTHPRLIERFGSEEFARKISPLENLDNTLPPMILFFGSEDNLIAFAYETVELNIKLGLDVRLWIAEGQKHGFFNKPPWLHSTSFLADEFLEEHGYLQGDPEIEMPSEGKLEWYLNTDL